MTVLGVPDQQSAALQVPPEPFAEPLHQSLNLFRVGALERLKYGGSVSVRYTPSGTNMWKWTFSNSHSKHHAVGGDGFLSFTSAGESLPERHRVAGTCSELRHRFAPRWQQDQDSSVDARARRGPLSGRRAP